MFNRGFSAAASVAARFLIVAAVAASWTNLAWHAHAETPVEISSLRFGASGSAPFEVTVTANATVVGGAQSGKAISSRITITGTQVSVAESPSRISLHWYYDNFSVDVAGKHFSVPLRSIELCEWVKDDHGRILSYYFFTDRLEKAVEEATGEPFQAEPSITDALNFLMDPDYSDLDRSNSGVFPANANIALNRANTDILPALERGIAVHGSNDYMKKLIKLMESFRSSLNWQSSVSFTDYRLRDGVEYARFSGGLSGSFRNNEDNSVTSFQSDGPVEVLIDTVTGAERSRNFPLKLTIRDHNNVVLDMKTVAVQDIQLSPPVTTRTTTPAVAQGIQPSDDIVSSAYRTALGSVVDVLAAESEGAGFAVRKDLIVTTARAVGSSKLVRVILGDGQSRKAEVVAVDAKLDLALIRISGPATLIPLTIDSDPPAVGNRLLMIGSPTDLQGALTTGVVSAIRKLDGVDVVQVDAPINTGNDGSPVINLAGQVIGILSTSLTTKSGLKGLGIAVSASEINRLIAKAGT